MFYNRLSDPEPKENSQNWFEKMFNPATFGYQGKSETQFDPAAHLPGADTRTDKAKTKPPYLLMGGAAVGAFLLLKKNRK